MCAALEQNWQQSMFELCQFSVQFQFCISANRLSYAVLCCSLALCSFLLQRAAESVQFRSGRAREESEETSVLLQTVYSPSKLLLKAFWSMFGLYFLLGTLSLVIGDTFLFLIPKTLRYVGMGKYAKTKISDSLECMKCTMRVGQKCYALALKMPPAILENILH